MSADSTGIRDSFAPAGQGWQTSHRHTSLNAATIGCMRGIESQSTGASRLAYSSRVEGVPLLAAGPEPLVLLAGRPAAQRAANPRARGVVTLLFLNLAIKYNRRFRGAIPEGAHTRLL